MTVINMSHAVLSKRVIDSANCLSFFIFLIWGSSNMPPFSLSSLRLGKDSRRYLIQSFSLLRALTDCFILVPIWCAVVERLISVDLLMVNLWYLTCQLVEPCVLSICVLHDYPTNKKLTIFKSTQMIHLRSS